MCARPTRRNSDVHTAVHTALNSQRYTLHFASCQILILFIFLFHSIVYICIYIDYMIPRTLYYTSASVFLTACFCAQNKTRRQPSVVASTALCSTYIYQVQQRHHVTHTYSAAFIRIEAFPYGIHIWHIYTAHTEQNTLHFLENRLCCVRKKKKKKNTVQPLPGLVC